MISGYDILGAENGRWQAIAAAITAREQFATFVRETEAEINTNPISTASRRMMTRTRGTPWPARRVPFPSGMMAREAKRQPKARPKAEPRPEVKAMPKASQEAADLRSSLIKPSGIEGDRDGRWQFPIYPEGIKSRVVRTNVQASRSTDMKEARLLSTIEQGNVIKAAAGLPELIAKPNVSMWESFLRRLTHVFGLLSSGEAAPANFMTEVFGHDVAAGWEAWISLYAFYCAHFSVLETRNFMSPSSLIVLLRGVIEKQHEELVETARAEPKEAVNTQIGDYRRGNFFLVTDLVFFAKSNKGAYTAMPDGLNAHAGWNMANMICPSNEDINPNGELLTQLTRCKTSIKDTVESGHLWISLADAVKWRNKGGQYYVVKSDKEGYFKRCADIINMIQAIAPRPIIVSINTTADIFALNEPLTRYTDVIVAGVKAPAMVFKSYAFWRSIQRYRGMGGKLTSETEGYMWYVLDRRQSRERVLSSARMKSQTIWEVEDKISALLSEKGKEIMKSTAVSGIESTGFRFDPVTEDLKERMAEKSWTTIEVRSIALSIRDRTVGSVVHVNDVRDYLCDQCKHGEEGRLEILHTRRWRREHRGLCEQGRPFSHGSGGRTRDRQLLSWSTAGRGHQFEVICVSLRIGAEGLIVAESIFTSRCDPISGRRRTRLATSQQREDRIFGTVLPCRAAHTMANRLLGRFPLRCRQSYVCWLVG